MTRVVLEKRKIVRAGGGDKKPAKPVKPETPKRTEAPIPSEGDLPRHVAKLEKDMNDLKKAFGISEAEFQTQGVCPQDGLVGEVTGEDAYSSRKYVFYRDKKGHEWFDDVPND